VRQARAGDQAAARALYERHVDAAWGYCLAFCRGDNAIAQDLCQETFATALSRLDQLQEGAAFPGWLRTITRRTCLRWADQRRRERDGLQAVMREPRRVVVKDPGLSGAGQPEAIVSEVIAACPDDGLRSAALLFYTDPPHSTAEIGELLGISRTAVTSRLHRFRHWARTRMLGRLVDALEAL